MTLVTLFTPLHRALGREASPLSEELLRTAVSEQVAEADDLDWKKELPHAKNDDAGDEFAKDVAAMANSGGGWIIYGVSDGGDSRACALTPVKWNANEASRLRALAYGRVYPPAVGVHFEVVDIDGGAVVAMRIPDSAEAPHFARFRQTAVRAPRRNGADTVFMSEHEIERAYAARFARRTAWEEDLQGLFQAATRASSYDTVVNGVLVSRPAEPSTRHAGMAKQHAYEIISSLPRRKLCAERIICPDMGLLKPGLRSWVHETSSPQGSRCAIYSDGSLSLSVELGNWTDDPEHARTWPVGEPFHTVTRAVEWFIDDGVALAGATAETLNIDSPLRLTASIVGTGTHPLVIRDEHHWIGNDWNLADESASRALRAFEAVQAVMTAHSAEAEHFDVAQQLALDLLNQAGIERLKSLQPPPGERAL